MSSPRQVLVADSSDLLRRSLARILRDDGMEVVEVPDGVKALSETMLRKPDVLLLGLSLPLLSTDRLIGILRNNPNTKSIPILLLGDPGKEPPPEGESEVVRRPLREESVLAKVHALLESAPNRGTEEVTARDPGRRKEAEMTEPLTKLLMEKVADRREEAKGDVTRAGWVSPSYSVSREVRLDPAVLEANRCVGFDVASPTVESYRVLRTRILHRTPGSGGTTVMVTSSVPGEGKTLTAVNLALTFAKSYSQTALLVDADLKRQQVRQVLGFESGKGLGDYLLDGCDVSELIVWPGVEKLTVISGGKRIEESSELLGSPGMKVLVRDMKTRYPDRYVFFDVPPVLAGADAIAFASLVDHILFVVQAERTSMADVHKALALLPKEKILGIVLNRQADADASKYYYY